MLETCGKIEPTHEEAPLLWDNLLCFFGLNVVRLYNCVCSAITIFIDTH